MVTKSIKMDEETGDIFLIITEEIKISKEEAIKILYDNAQDCTK